MALTITLTDDDALVFLNTYARDHAANFLAQTFDTPLATKTTADMQMAIDAHWAKRGVSPAVEIETSPEDAARILAEVTAGAPVSGPVFAKDGSEIDTSLIGFGCDTIAIPGLTVTSRLPYTNEFVTTDRVAVAGVEGRPGLLTIVPAGPPAIVAIPPSLDKDGLPWDQRIHSASKSVNKDGTWRTKKNLDPATAAVVTAELKQVMAIPAVQQPLLAPLTAFQASQIPAPPREAMVPTPPTAAVPVPPAPAAPLVASSAGSIPPPPLAPAVLVPAASTGSGAPGHPAISATIASLSDIPVPPPPTVAAVPGIPAGYTADPARPGVFLPPTLGFGELMFKITQAVTQGRLTHVKVEEVAKAAGLPSIVLIQSRPDLISGVAQALGLV